MNQRPLVTLNISPKRFVLVLGCGILGLAAAHFITNILYYELGHEYQWGLLRQFHLNQEANLPTWYSASTLLIVSLLLGLIGSAKYRFHDTYAGHWLCLAAIFLWLSADEGSRLHEMSEVLYSRPHYSGLFYYPWVIGGLVVVVIVGLSYLKFLLHLPVGTRRQFVLSGGLYVGGALGLEAMEARFEEQYGYQNLTYDVMTGIEEICEMAGIAIFIYALMRYAAVAFNGNVAVTFSALPKTRRQ
jgi:hypothetical protein